MRNGMEKVVVTGGAGFIGSHLAEGLIEYGYNVTILDDLSTGKKDNIRLLLEKENVEFIEGSVTNLPLLQDVLRDVHSVFHLAAIPSVPRSIDDPKSSHEVNATGSLNVLLAARDNGVHKVIYSSSSSVYGDTPSLPKREDMVPYPKSPYAVAKLEGENYCRVFQEVYGLSTICLRYFNVYGPRQDPNSEYAAVVPRFIRSCFNGDSLVIYDDGEQTRDFTYVKDVVTANIMAEKSDASGVFNISKGDSITINMLARLIKEIVMSEVELIHQEARPGDIKHSLADISKAKIFGFESQYDLRTGLEETVKWFNNS